MSAVSADIAVGETMTTTCKLTTRAGKPCPFPDLGRGLCHVHDPDRPFAMQHPRSRAQLLARADVQAVLGGLAVIPDPSPHRAACPTCACTALRAV